MEAIQAIQLVGAVLILSAFLATQMRRLDAHARPYLALNVVGAGVLAVVAAADRDWGFLLLEGVWALVSAWGLVRPARMSRPPIS